MHSIASARTYPSARRIPLLVFREGTTDGSARPHPDGVPETVADWQCVHEHLVRLARSRAAHEREVCRWLLAAQRLGVHARAGHASLREYAERIIGLNARETEERLRVARALAELPRLDAALAAGRLCWSAVRELSRVATSETESAWLDWATHRRAREVERAVAARAPGDRPDDRPDPARVVHRLAFDVRAETLALFRDLQSAVRADLGGAVDDDTLLFEIARRALGGPADEGRASYQVAVTRCDTCRQASVDAAGQSHPVDPIVAEMAACDAQHIGRVDPSHHVGASRTVEGDAGTARSRAHQSIPPATRRAVVRRDHKRCVVPGCNHHRFLDVHHLDPRAEGGGHHPDRLAVLCGAHHRAVHAGTFCIDGNATTGFAFRHADGAPYGAPVNAVAVDTVREVLGALDHLGFKATRARALVDEALRTGEATTAASLLQAALRAT